MHGTNVKINIDEIQTNFLITPLQQITTDFMQSINASYLNRYSDQVTHWKNEESGCIPGTDGAFI